MQLRTIQTLSLGHPLPPTQRLRLNWLEVWPNILSFQSSQGVGRGVKRQPKDSGSQNWVNIRINRRLLGQTGRIPNPLGPGWALRLCISHKISGAAAAGPAVTLGEPLASTFKSMGSRARPT